jgi:methyltransferase (TIGR00027 family)
LRLPGATRIALGLQELRLPGVFGAFVCRTRFIDDALLDALADGIRQVVILGAGFDSRAYRIPGLEDARVFEVDTPAMLAFKRSCLAKMLGVLPSNVVHVPADFRRRALSEVLSSAGYDARLPTFFICEGLTQYLAAEAVDDILGFVARGAAGNGIAFTYIDHRVIEGTLRRSVDRRILSLVARLSEPWITGFRPEQMPDELKQRGLAVTAHVHASDYQDRYLRSIGRALAVYDAERVVVAETGVGRPAALDELP